MNALISVGCNVYDTLPCLNGAEKDASQIYEALTANDALYDKNASQLLVSPDGSTFRKSLNGLFSTYPTLNILTIFFAGHAAVKSGNFYLCLRDSDYDGLSITAFPIVDFFSMINEFHPKQANIVLDACEAGGASFDLHQLLRKDVVGSSDSTRITLLLPDRLPLFLEQQLQLPDKSQS
jgi:uncharacterized caspase-like protein